MVKIYNADSCSFFHNSKGGPMKRAVCFWALILMLSMIGGWAMAQQDPIIYPAKGQSQEQMEKDKYECYSWAKQQTGFDPMQVPQASTPPPAKQPPKGGAVKGAAGGAAVGAAIGSLSGNAGKGAAAGAIGGGMVGGMRRAEQQKQQQAAEQQWAQQQSAEYTQKRNTYNRAYGACLEGRGYTVK
jgi:hypothetical protein